MHRPRTGRQAVHSEANRQHRLRQVLTELATVRAAERRAVADGDLPSLDGWIIPAKRQLLAQARDLLAAGGRPAEGTVRP